MRIFIIKALAVLPLLCLSACTSLLYHPSTEIFFPPEKYSAAPKEVWIGSRSGGKIHAWYFKSQASEKKPKALLLYFHGNGENITSHYLNLLWTAPVGYEFLIFDYRGYGESRFADSDQKVTPQSTIEDGLDAIDWTENYSQTNKIPYGIYAQSLGGAVGLRTIEEWSQAHPGGFHGKIVFLDSTFDSYHEAARSLLASSSAITWPFQWLGYLLIDNSKAPEKLLQALPPVPFVVIHGNQDRSVNYKLGRKLYSDLPKPKEFWHVESGSHVDVFFGHHAQFRKKFVKKLNCVFTSVCDSAKEDPVFKKDEPVIPDWTYTYGLPYPPHQKHEILQGFDDSFSHKGDLKYAIDFRLPEGTPVCAIRGGKVVAAHDSSARGGPNSDFLNDANFVVIQHRDGTFAEYYHLKKDTNAVKVGQIVNEGAVLAESGNTGFSTEPHLHVMVYVKNDDGNKLSVPIVFDSEEAPAIRLEKGESYTRAQ